jgi:hypothetical protein
MSDIPKDPERQEIVTKTPPALDFRYLLAARPEEILIRDRLKGRMPKDIKSRKTREIVFLLDEIDRLRGALRYREILAQPRPVTVTSAVTS